MAKQTPIPQNPIGESFVWRDWFQKLSDRVFGSAASLDVPIQPEYGGTGITTYNKGDIIYSNATDNLTRLPAPSVTSILQMTALGVPSWTTASTGTVTSVGGTGTVNGLTLTGTVTSSGNLTLGGTLDLSSPPAIGGTTPAAGTFTTLTATGQTSLGGAAGSESFRVVTRASATDYVEADGGTSGTSGVYLSAQGASASTNLFLSAKTATIRFYTNSKGSTEQFRVAHTASAVNYVQVTGAATGNDPTISAQGSDANTGLIFLSKGSTGLTFRTRGGGTVRNALVLVDNGASSVNYLQIQSNLTATAPSLSAQGSDTNIPLVLQPKGTGALQAQQTDSTATGGNARGAYAVDWQTQRGSAARVASGSNGFIGAGYDNAVSGGYAVVAGGYSNASTASQSAVLGGKSNIASGVSSVIVGGLSNTSTGYYNFIGGGYTNSGTANASVTTQSGTMNGTTAVTLSGSNASIKVGQYITGTSIAADTYVAAISGTSLTLSQAASGSSTSTLSFYTPHGVVVGGGNNQATGSYSFIGGGGDAGTAGNRNVASGAWSTAVGGFKTTASGLWSFAGGGGGNTSSGEASVVVGGGSYGSGLASNTASGTSSFVGSGYGNNAGGYCTFVGGGSSNSATGNFGTISGGVGGATRVIGGNHVFPANQNPFGLVGSSQAGLLILAKQTTDATATVLVSDTSAAGTTNQVILPNNSAYTFRGEIVSGVTGGGNSKSWTIEGLIKRGANAASTTLVGSTVTSMFADIGAATWTIALSADTTNGGLAVTFTGQAGTTIRTVCQVRTTEMTF